MGAQKRLRAALTLSLSGQFTRQGRDAADAVRMWAEAAGADLDLVDDGGTKVTATDAYAAWLQTDDVDLLLGPYASGLTRAVIPLARSAGRILWNHGGSADDLMQPGVASLLTPASRYFDGALEEIARSQVDTLLVVQGSGPFARAVCEGALTRAGRFGVHGRKVDAEALSAEDAPGTAVLTAGKFEHDLDVVKQLRHWQHQPAVIGTVAAGIPAFGRELGVEAAEGVLAPVHWWPDASTPEVGPSGTDFADTYRRRTGQEPSYVAAQAAAGGYLAAAARSRGHSVDDLPDWTTSTLLGGFALDREWRQVGHRMTTIRWRDGRMVRA